jgi:hypothetical protein
LPDDGFSRAHAGEIDPVDRARQRRELRHLLGRERRIRFVHAAVGLERHHLGAAAPETGRIKAAR